MFELIFQYGILRRGSARYSLLILLVAIDVSAIHCFRNYVTKDASLVSISFSPPPKKKFVSEDRVHRVKKLFFILHNFFSIFNKQNEHKAKEMLP